MIRYGTSKALSKVVKVSSK